MEANICRKCFWYQLLCTGSLIKYQCIHVETQKKSPNKNFWPYNLTWVAMSYLID